jgi:alpha/beta superfamily hydrolase
MTEANGSRHVSLTSTDGVDLEADLDLVTEPRAALVICHAHPGMQGTMKSPLLLAVRDALTERHWSVLRFNYRGVGASTGEFGGGEGEVQDAIRALRFIRLQHADAPIAMLGWSFGAGVALRAAAHDPEVEACVAIAPSIVSKESPTDVIPPLRELGLEIPVLVVCGSNDDVTPPERARQWAEAGGARYVEIPAANHFFWAKYDPLVFTVTEFLDEAV